MKYFRDVDKGNIVRKPEEGMYLEYISIDNPEWTRTKPNSSYEREYWLGEGNTCLFDLSEVEAERIIQAWQSSPAVGSFRTAKEG